MGENEDNKLSREDYERIKAELQAVVDHMGSLMPEGGAARMKEVMNFRHSITTETDRGAVLMAAAFLDDKLKELIERRLVQDKKVSKRAFEFNGPIGTFSARIDCAYLLGILPKNAQKDFHTIRAIRNKFAHQAAALTYEDEGVKKLCDKLMFHGVKDAASGGSKFRRSVMGLLTYISLAFEKMVAIEAAEDYEIPDRTDAYKIAASIFTGITGKEYPLKHEHE
jgi:DNA-binding MltR family transcriptional regulator